jgi:hypothetical protein
MNDAVSLASGKGRTLDFTGLDLDSAEPTNISWAFAYASTGMRIFPARADETPLIKSNLADATTDPQQIRRWWAVWPGADVAWALPREILVLKLDGSGTSNGVGDFRQLAGIAADLVATPQSSTPVGGGRHLFFAAGERHYGNWVRPIPGKAIETRAEGGYVVLPSPGNGRQWLKSLTIARAPVPDWVPTVKREPPDPREDRSFAGDTLAEIAAALGGKRQPNGSYMCHCPAHADATPSLSISAGYNGMLVHCFAGCPQEAVIARLRAKGLWPEPGPKLEPKRDAAAWARAAWKKARSIDECTAHPYFSTRGLDTRRFANLHHGIRIDERAIHKESETIGPAVIAAASDADGIVWGVQRTYLTADETAKRGVDPPRKSLGPIKGHSIRFGPMGATVLVAEGIEDAMTGALAMGFAHGALACAGAGFMASLVLPTGVAEVIILADSDTPGRKSAAAAADVFEAAGKAVRVAYPPEGVKDFNDLVKGKTGPALDEAYAVVRAAIEAAGEPAPQLPDIDLDMKTPDIVDQAISALEAANAPVYTQAERVVGVSVLKLKTYDNAPTYQRVVSRIVGKTKEGHANTAMWDLERKNDKDRERC